MVKDINTDVITIMNLIGSLIDSGDGAECVYLHTLTLPGIWRVESAWRATPIDYFVYVLPSYLANSPFFQF